MYPKDLQSYFLPPEKPGPLARFFGVIMLVIILATSGVFVYAGAFIAYEALPKPTKTIERDIASNNYGAPIDYRPSFANRRIGTNGRFVKLRGDADTYFIEPMLITTPFDYQWRKAKRAKLVYETKILTNEKHRYYKVVGIELDGSTYLIPAVYMIERGLQSLLLMFMGGAGIVMMGYTLFQVGRGKS